jgi:acetyl esterase/lipase
MRCLVVTALVGLLATCAARAQTYGPYPQETVYPSCGPGAGSVERVVVMIHGGVWYGFEGQPISGQDQYLCDQVARDGTLVIPIDFRGAQVAPWPSLLLDIQMAIRWARETYRDLPVSVLGTSSGGQVALMAGVSPRISAPAVDPDNEAALLPDVSSTPDCVVSFSGETDLLQMYGIGATWRQMIDSLTGKNPISVLSASPIAQIGLSDMPPTMVLHGKDDPLIPVSQAKEFFAALSAARESAQHEDELIITPGRHVLVGLTQAQDAYYARQIMIFVEHNTK